MYTPKHFQLPDHQEAVSFMQKYSFATIITVMNGVPEATHLPFIVEQRGDEIVLISHFAKANPQVASVFNETSLVIFTEPHAYISPTNYEKEQNVPTWNYLSVHAYGKATIIEDKKDIAALLEKMIGFYEAGYRKQWDNLPDDYKSKMMNGITAFEMIVTDLQGKKKLSQLRTELERENIIESLSKSTDSAEREIANYMKKEN
ncbi:MULTISPECIES: FMN-binding negative transcriptional regulator [unclassified Mucilaginibacter]|uniref:FMN-binding negative transcriptional regulator n=1 Tax=unclassified Mucilaginibacter TaxID=2617802 RepID=UPI002AC9D58A|nr:MULTISPECIES: FMN-binding negative transcriptional regulator [unclassified Mucilaginibacter]MEB0249796.1 FMN-binding negative transcriptional regulator [Mucilaginibacter sp. 5B2]MEB0260806.1 FMN-binding negative transcriptional regulator [Mucilaginibacter sp. 10I4]MEB0279021.1 FMN-binding negative transcriptional regulator [Mucilaginibacter sp. 10B2]MEB0299960.1 FMN-binding negative transcriptional regulator [Mucilaginibacter sp. 5C4]WPX22199.1 FMN-binding negative transcriptional regulator